jgi:hypothetical protein
MAIQLGNLAITDDSIAHRAMAVKQNVKQQNVKQISARCPLTFFSGCFLRRQPEANIIQVLWNYPAA